jgi:cob(I)alamin adenosyltransferase
VSQESIIYLENRIDLYNKSLKPLSSFVLPGGSALSIKFHTACVLCRRCERFVVSILKEESIDLIVVKYLNRLSDLLFVLSRYANFILNKEEILWNANFEDKL